MSIISIVLFLIILLVIIQSIVFPYVDQDNIFQQAVYAEIIEAGYNAVQDVGQAGYKIDIAIIDPNDKSKFLLAVECDGGKSQSSSTARDRDRLSQSVLENLGWKFHRIWSTDWFQNPVSEMEKLEKAIQGINVGVRHRIIQEKKDAIAKHNVGFLREWVILNIGKTILIVSGILFVIILLVNIIIMKMAGL